MTETLEQTLTAYDVWLDRQPLAAKTRSCLSAPGASVWGISCAVFPNCG